MAGLRPLLALFFAFCICGEVKSAQYLGKFLGKLSELHHGVSGEVYAVDSRTLHIKDFSYDGQGPAAYFYASTSKAANNAGFRLRDESGSGDVIRRYRKEGVTLTLPEGKSLNNIKIFYVWCEEFAVNFGDVKIPRSFDYPRPQKIDALKGVHNVASDNIVIVDAQTLLIPNLSYDGEAPDAKFWVGRGAKPTPQGIRVPDENGKEVPLRRYDGKTVVLTLPGGLTVFDIGHFGIWCEAFTVDFGHVRIPQNLNIPPSLKMLGVSPQSKLNCEVLYDDLAFEVRWAVAGESIVLQLVAKLDEGEYMSFGVSGDESKTVMIGGDAVVAWVDKQTLKGYADDYYLDAKSQCSGPTGSCPDTKLADNTNNIRLLNAAMVNGYSIVTYQRPLKAADEFDKPIFTNRSQAIIWGIGPLNQRNEVSFHSHYTKGDRFLDFGRPAKWSCPMPESDPPPMKPVVKETVKEVVKEEVTTTAAPSRSRNSERRRGSNNNRNQNKNESSEDSEKSATIRTRQQTERRGTANRGRGKPVPTPAPVSNRNAWDIPAIKCDEPEDGVFYAQMGPTGGKRGYPAITGHVGWGISWYINGLLIPVINVVRGKKYTFVVEGGFDPEVPAKYHPFYITDDPIGGYEHKTDEEKKSVKIYAGASKKDGNVIPTGTGRLCHWTQKGDRDADDFDSFGAYQRTLELKCDQGEPGVIQWTPNKDTPDTVYYQCFTHRYLGWKINVLDSCEEGAASEIEEIIVPAPDSVSDKLDLEESPSIRVETRVKPNNIPNMEVKEDKPIKYIVSEHSTILPKIDPTIDGQSDIPILFHQPHQSYLNPYYGAFFAHNANFNPYAFDNPIYRHYYQHNFRPSTLIGEAPTTVTATTTTPTTTTTETPKPSTTITTSTTISPTSKKPLHDKLIVAASNQNLLTSMAKHPPSFMHHNKMPFRRPPLAPLGGGYPMHPQIRFQMKMPMRQPPPPPPPRTMIFSYKKPTIYRPMMNQNRHPYPMENNPIFANVPISHRQTPPPANNIIILKPQALTSTRQPETINNIHNQIKHVEISPIQAATEREPEIQTAASTSVINFTPPSTPTFSLIRMRPAFNTGFKPETVVVESGFKPIVTQAFQDRIDKNDEEVEIENESEIGVVKIDGNAYKAIQSFEPIFVPSPTDKPRVVKKPYHKKSKLKQQKVDRFEPETAAAERIDTYYLPPVGQKAQIEIAQQPSNIDFDSGANLSLDSPPDVVVTYDGKRVSGASLTAKLADRSSILDQRASKAAEFIKARPQFLPFRGELPPLDGIFVNNAQQLHVINRELDTPSLPPSTNPIGSTKLIRVQSSEKQFVNKRIKRFAHHTPEHTAEQAAAEKKKNSSSNLQVTQLSIYLIAFFLMRYL